MTDLNFDNITLDGIENEVKQKIEKTTEEQFNLSVEKLDKDFKKKIEEYNKKELPNHLDVYKKIVEAENLVEENMQFTKQLNFEEIYIYKYKTGTFQNLKEDYFNLIKYQITELYKQYFVDYKNITIKLLGGNKLLNNNEYYSEFNDLETIKSIKNLKKSIEIENLKNVINKEYIEKFLEEIKNKYSFNQLFKEEIDKNMDKIRNHSFKYKLLDTKDKLLAKAKGEKEDKDIKGTYNLFRIVFNYNDGLRIYNGLNKLNDIYDILCIINYVIYKDDEKYLLKYNKGFYELNINKINELVANLIDNDKSTITIKDNELLSILSLEETEENKKDIKPIKKITIRYKKQNSWDSKVEIGFYFEFNLEQVNNILEKITVL